MLRLFRLGYLSTPFSSKNETKKEPQAIKKAENPKTKKPADQKPAAVSSSNRIILAFTMSLLSYLYV